MHLLPVVILILTGVSIAVVCARRAMFGREMERAFEVLKPRRQFPNHEAPSQATIRKTIPIKDRIISLDTEGITLPVEASPQLPRAS